MFTKTVDLLEAQTHAYWKLSNARTGRSKDRITVEGFIKEVNELEFNLGPTRALLRSVKILGEAVVIGKSKKNKKPALIHILPFRILTGGTNG